MTNKTYRFAAVAAVLLALCLVFVAPVSAEVQWNTVKGVNTATVSDVDGLKAALAYIETDTDAVADYVINLNTGNYEIGTLQINQTSERNVSLIGNGNLETILKGAIQINGKRNHDGIETLKFENLKFDGSGLTNADSSGVIYFMNGQSGYAHNVFLTNCEIVGPGKQINGIEIPRDNGYVYGLTLDTVKISNCNIAVQGYAHNDLSIVNCEFTLCSSGVNIQGGGLQSLDITDSTISVEKYALRAGTQGTDFGSLTLSGNTLTSENVGNAATIIFRGKFTEDDEVNVVNNIITGKNGFLMQDVATSDSYTLDSSFFDLSDNYWGDGSEPTEDQLGGISFEAGTSYYTALSADGTEIDTSSSATAIGSAVAEVGGVYYDDFEDALLNLTAENNTLTLLRDVTISENWDERYTGGRTTVPVTIEGDEHKITFTGAVYDGGNYHSVFRFQADATVKNLTVDLSQASGTSGKWQRVISTTSNLTVDNCIFIGNSSLTNTRGISFGEGAGTAIGTLQLTVTNSEFKNWKRGVSDNENTQDVKSMTLTGNTFENAGVLISAHETVTFTNNVMNGGGVTITSWTAPINEVVATGNTLDETQKNSITSEKGILSLDADSGFAIGFTAQIGNAYYATLQGAVDAATGTAENPTVIELLGTTEVTGAGVVVPSGKHIKIDFNGLTYNVTGTLVGSSNTETNCFQLLKDSTVIMTNGKIVASAEAKKGGSGSEAGQTDKAATLIQNYADLTLENMILDGNTLTHPTSKYSLGINNGNVVLTGSTQILAADDGVAFDVCRYSSYAGPTVTVESGVTIDGDIEYSSSDYNAGTQHKLTINGGSFTGGLNILGEPSAEYLKGNIIIYGGTFTFNPSAYIASGMEVVQPGDKYLVQKYVDRSSSSSSSKPVEEPEEPEQPEEPVVEPETPAAPGEVAASTEVTDGGEVAFETTVVDEETGEQSAPAAADDEVKGVVLPEGTEGTVEFVPVSEQPAPAGKETQTKRVFEINVPQYEKGKASVIKFQMTVAEIEADGKTAAEVALWHFDEETGEWTKLVTSYTIVNGIVYFEAITNDFSPFAIIYDDAPVEEPEQPTEEPETPASPAPVLGVLAALGAAVVLRRK